jgi:hypothetical protein
MKIDKTVSFALFSAAKGRIIGAAMLSKAVKGKISDSMLSDLAESAVGAINGCPPPNPFETTPLPKGVVASADSLHSGSLYGDPSHRDPSRSRLPPPRRRRPAPTSHAPILDPDPSSPQMRSRMREFERLLDRLIEEQDTGMKIEAVPVNTPYGVYLAAYLDEGCKIEEWEAVVKECELWEEAVATMVVRYGGFTFDLRSPLRVSVNHWLYHIPRTPTEDA